MLLLSQSQQLLSKVLILFEEWPFSPLATSHILTKKLRATVVSVYFVVVLLPEPDKENGSQWPHVQNWRWNKADRILSLFIELNIKKMIIMWELEGY